MLAILRNWFHRYLSNPEAVALAMMLLGGILCFVVLKQVLSPILTALVLAYTFQWLARMLEEHGVPRAYSLLSVYILFLGSFLSVILVILPLIWQQLGNLFEEMPNMIQHSQTLLYTLSERFPEYLSRADVDSFSADVMFEIRSVGKTLVSASLASIPSIILLMIYLVVVPFMVFFFLKDSKQISRWFSGFLPKQHHLLENLWREADAQFGNYIRGKIAEIAIVGIATYIAFIFLHMKYAALLAFFVGLSVLVPYVGAVIVTVPVLLVAFFQWGFNNEFWYVFFAYGAIQVLDGNVIVPLLFSEAVNLHPVAIMISIIVFGGLWGLWGVFFAIPLAILLKVLLSAWPTAGSQT